DPLDLAELVHQAGLVLEATRGVDQDRVGASLDPLLYSLEGDARGVGALRSADDVDAHPLAPGRQLVDGGGAEGVGRAEDDGAVLGDQDPRELADRGRLAGA